MLKCFMLIVIKNLGGGKLVFCCVKLGMVVLGCFGMGYLIFDVDDEIFYDWSNLFCLLFDYYKVQRLQFINIIKFEFSNYVCVDVYCWGSKNNKCYEFEWWGYKYSWKCYFDKQLNLVFFYLI